MTPLCLIQARLHSTRLPEKMLADVGGKPLLWYAWNAAVEDFGRENVVIAYAGVGGFMMVHAVSHALSFPYFGNENDLLGRLHAAAHFYRWHPHDIIIRVTPDDVPIDTHRERCTLAQLDHWHTTVTDPAVREHVGKLWPPRLEINTQADLDELRARVESHER